MSRIGITNKSSTANSKGVVKVNVKEIEITSFNICIVIEFHFQDGKSLLTFTHYCSQFLVIAGSTPPTISCTSAELAAGSDQRPAAPISEWSQHYHIIIPSDVQQV
ncbi:hypothetical protein J6590_101064 [Homalodisca vitripennis]|nr:hypothetical protein J6590_101064 [Homalodisca vitripennis]